MVSNRGGRLLKKTIKGGNKMNKKVSNPWRRLLKRPACVHHR